MPRFNTALFANHPERVPGISDGSCGGNLTGYFGVIKSPRYPETYPNFAHCVWNIKVRQGFRVRIRFTEFNVEPFYKCEYDWVLLRSDNNSTPKFCGDKGNLNPYKPKVLTSPTNQASLIFHSDYSNEERYIGFVAHFVAVDTDECSKSKGECDHFCHNYLGGHYCSCKAGYKLMPDKKSCNVVCNNQQLTARRGTITTPEFPGSYPKNANCDWTISVQKGYQITLYFRKFNIEDHPEVACPYDYLKVSAGIGRRHGPLCGKSLPQNITSSGNYMHLQFVSDATGAYPGFKAFYETHGIICPKQSAPRNGLMKGSSFSFKDTLEFECLPGYQLFGSYIRECTNAGRWSGVTPSCRRRSCGHPGILRHGSIVSNGFKYKSTVNYTCDPFFELFGQQSRKCQSDGTWSGAIPKCIAICGETRFNNTRRQQCRQRIVGGKDTVKGAYPWHVLLKKNGNVALWRIATQREMGTNRLFANRSAHCVRNSGGILPLNKFEVVFGLYRTSKDDARQVQKRNLSQIITHDGFDFTLFDSDLALIKLDGEVTISEYVRPICLPQTKSQVTLVSPSKFGMAVGWGKTIGRQVDADMKSLADTLKEACLPVVTKRVCDKAFLNEGLSVTNNMLCAGHAAGGTDICQGDSGGGFVFFDPKSNKWVLGGVVSWGSTQGCGLPNKYGVYVKASRFVRWIQQNLF
ncbi:hypothetical protein QZH41_013126 [Actinostola sp. cb2023]|nr:hypothetical protein QZH41_013126 [Actinostola sp. cb2023]